MKYFVKWTCTGMTAGGEKLHIEDDVIHQLEIIERSGKMKDGGPLLGVRGGYFVFDIDKPSELLGLLGRVFWDNFQIDVHPVLSYKELGEFMKVEYKKAA